jgi:hypothetical protein
MTTHTHDDDLDDINDLEIVSDVDTIIVGTQEVDIANTKSILQYIIVIEICILYLGHTFRTYLKTKHLRIYNTI